VFEYGEVSLFQGSISRATNGVDFSWMASIVFGGWRIGCCAAPSRILSPRLRLPPGWQLGLARKIVRP
jgi:hypothetical protein